MSANLAESRVKQTVCWSQLEAGLMNQGWEMTSKLCPPRRSVRGPFPVPQDVFSGHFTQLCVALVVVVRQPCSPTSLLLAQAAAGCAQCAPSCQRLCTSASFLPQQMVLQPGKAAGNWHQPGLVLGRRRMKQQQGKGLNTVIYFFLQGRCMCCFFALALLRARAGMMYVLQIQGD